MYFSFGFPTTKSALTTRHFSPHAFLQKEHARSTVASISQRDRITAFVDAKQLWENGVRKPLENTLTQAQRRHIKAAPWSTKQAKKHKKLRCEALRRQVGGVPNTLVSALINLSSSTVTSMENG